MDFTKKAIWFQLPKQLDEVKTTLKGFDDIDVADANLTDTPATFANLAEVQTHIDTLKGELETKLNEIITAINQ